MAVHTITNTQARHWPAIHRLKKRLDSHGKAFIADFVQIGERLSRLKDRVGHGKWLPWLRQNFDWSGETAANYMAAYQLSKSPEFLSLKNLPLELIYMLGRRNVPEEARVAVAARIEAGETVTPSYVRHTIRLTGKTAPVNEGHLSIVSTKRDVPTQREALTGEDLRQAFYRHMVDFVIDTATQMPFDRARGEARAIVVAASAAHKRDTFAASVGLLGELIDELRRALNERLIEVPSLRVVPGGGGDAA
jgi:hypothetical protein